MSENTAPPLITAIHDGEETSVPAERDLLRTRACATSQGSPVEGHIPVQTEVAAAPSAAADEQGLEALNAIRNTTADAVAKVRDQLVNVATDLSRAGEAVQSCGADFGRFWEECSDGFLRNEAKKTSDPGLESPRPGTAHWDHEPGDGSAGHRPGQVANDRIERAETVLGDPIPVEESAAPVSVDEPKDFQSQLPTGVAKPCPDGELPSNAAADRDPSAIGQNQSLADLLNQSGNLESAQTNLLRLLEQTIAGHQRTLDQAAKLLEAQSINANFTLALLGTAYQQSEAVLARLEQLEAQQSHSRNAQISG